MYVPISDSVFLSLLYSISDLRTYIRFGGSGEYPSSVSMTCYPDTNPLSFGSAWTEVGGVVDPINNTVKVSTSLSSSRWAIGIPRLGKKSEQSKQNDGFVRRFYSIKLAGGCDSNVILSFRYNQSELPEGMDESSLKLYMLPNVVNTVTSGWNLVSLPVRVDNRRRTFLYPTATSDAFTYNGSYIIKDTITNGVGYWLKFGHKQSIVTEGFQIIEDSISVIPGWNMVGSISSIVPIDKITSNPPGIILSNFFQYDSIYVITNILEL